MTLDKITVMTGDCLVRLAELPDDSVDLLCVDPPYGLKFMGHDWDRAVPPVEVWQECLRILKPGAFGFILCTPRQDCQARMIMNLEAAGFVTGFTSIMWTYSQGFPKAANLSKLADKRAIVACPDCDNGLISVGPEAVQVGVDWDGEPTYGSGPQYVPCGRCKGSGKVKGAEREIVGKYSSSENTTGEKSSEAMLPGKTGNGSGVADITAPATPEAKALDGAYAGFQPKPAFEPVLIAMKPLSEKTYLDQALTNGKGCTWLDGGRIPTGDTKGSHWTNRREIGDGNIYQGGGFQDVDHGSNCPNGGRFPANVLCCDDVLNDGRVSKGVVRPATGRDDRGVPGYTVRRHDTTDRGHSDSGSYSRYFDLDRWFADRIASLPESVRRVFPWLIVPKAAKREKNRGVEVNKHPTVKPTKLMQYLITIGSRKGDLVLDPYCGSGTTGVAATVLSRRFVGVELDPKWADVARRRIAGVFGPLFAEMALDEIGED